MQSVQEFTVTKEHYTMQVALFVIAKDVLAVITGGDHPHIGDVTAVAKGEEPQTVRYPSHDGRFHKDDFLSERLVKKVAPLVPGSLTVLAGVHVDHITKTQLIQAGPMVDELAQQVAAWLLAHPIQFSDAQYYGDDEQPS